MTTSFYKVYMWLYFYTYVKLCMNVVTYKEIRVLNLSFKEKWKNAVNSRGFVAKHLVIPLSFSKTIGLMI